MSPSDRLARLPKLGARADDAQQLAHIVSVTGSQAVAVLENSLQGAPQRAQIGMVVKIRTPRAEVIGLISGMTVPVPVTSNQNDEMRVVELDLVGEITVTDDGTTRIFRRGVAGLPSLGDPVYLADREDLSCIYHPQGRAFAEIGTIYQDESIPAHAMVDDLLAKHFAVVGSTGSGKSCALAGILLSVLKKHPHAHIVLLDLHNEYATAFEGLAEAISPATLELPFWMLSPEELAEIITSPDGFHDEEVEILNEGVMHAKRRYADASRQRSNAGLRKPIEASLPSLESPIPFRLNDLVAYLDEQMGKLERSHNTLPYRHLKARIESLATDSRYQFMFGGLTVQDSMAEILGRIFRVPTDGKPITVLDLSAVPSEILNVVISTLCRITFDLGVWARGQMPITLICEEAHRYAPLDPRTGFGPTRRALARIAKEGRKYGISLGLVTQRPSELDPTILSQCNTVFALRLANELDQQVIRAATSDSALSLLNFLPSLGDGEAIAVGLGVTLPMRIRFTQLPADRAPASSNARFSTSWNADSSDPEFLAQIVGRWRQNRRSES
jgi:DNA helicase HerA-like ATPase